MAMIRKTREESIAEKVDVTTDSLTKELKYKDKGKEVKEVEEDEEDEEGEEDVLEEPKTLNKYVVIGCIVGGIIFIILIVLVISSMKSKPPVQENVQPTIDTNAIEKQELYEVGIGKNYINELKIYEQGNLENLNFRKDFMSEDQPEMFVKPIRIQNVKDSISYVKHRSQTGEGVEVYWLEGKYKGRNCVLTIPYSIYQSITYEGTIDVNVEVVTDKSNSQTITNFSAIAPQKSK